MLTFRVKLKSMTITERQLVFVSESLSMVMHMAAPLKHISDVCSLILMGGVAKIIDNEVFT